MFVTEQQSLAGEILALADRHGRGRQALMPILQAIQERYHHISDFAMQEVANALRIHPVEVYGVVTFFAFLNAEKKGRFLIRLCRTVSCDMKNKDAVARQLENDLGVEFGQTTHDGKFTLEWASCLGQCDQGPALLVNDQVFTQVDADKVQDILAACRRSFGANVAQRGGH
jgi:NADH:ubiquinone oxidoreductase subunit E